MSAMGSAEALRGVQLRVELLSVAILALMVGGSHFWASQLVTLSVLAGGLVAVVNFRLLALLLRRMTGGNPSRWLVFPLLGKVVLLFGPFLVATLVMGADPLGMGAGYSSVVLAVLVVGSMKVLEAPPPD